MCGRFTLTVDPADLQAAFPEISMPAEYAPRYNVAPSQPVAAITNADPARLDFLRWGLIPSWAKDPKIGYKMINARSETVAEKPAFRAAFKRRRCLIPADGFYEWRREAGRKSKTPMYIRLKSGAPFAFAGLWEIWHSSEGDELRTCTILTTTPNALVEKIHDRMPVILKPEAYAAWLSPEEEKPDRLSNLLKPYPASLMTAYAVSTAVNSPANDLPELVAPV